MIKVTGNDNNTIYYKCDCGSSGMCTVKPMDKEAALVLDVQCPACKTVGRMVLMQYQSEESKEKLEKALTEHDLSWGLVMDNKTVEE